MQYLQRRQAIIGVSLGLAVGGVVAVLAARQWARGAQSTMPASAPGALDVEAGPVRAARGLYDEGRLLAAKEDYRAACLTWKEGYRLAREAGLLHSRTDEARATVNDFLKALLSCTQRAEKTLLQVQSCDDVRLALDFAVDGDGYHEVATARLLSLKCGG